MLHRLLTAPLTTRLCWSFMSTPNYSNQESSKALTAKRQVTNTLLVSGGSVPLFRPFWGPVFLLLGLVCGVPFLCVFLRFFLRFFCICCAFPWKNAKKSQKKTQKNAKNRKKNRKNIEKKSHKKVQSRPSPHPVQVPLLALVTSQ